MPRPPVVPAAQWKRGLDATRRIAQLLASWEERARAMREGEEPPPRPRRRRRA